MKIAIVGTGIAGSLCARLLSEEHEITVFEASDHVGGHTNTIQVEAQGRTFAVDTGFIVYNQRTYPNFARLLAALGVETQPSDMGFSVRCGRTGLEYSGTSLDTLFAQRSNLLRPSFYRMLRDIRRFGGESLELLEGDGDGPTLGDYLESRGYSHEFRDHYILPMGGAIWSAGTESMRAFPARYFVQFFANHGMLGVGERPQWRVVSGGSSRYMTALTEPFRERIRLRTRVRSIRRFADRVEVTTNERAAERFDHVVLGAHADQALALLADADPKERAILGAIPYQENEAWLHTDESVLPRRRRAWAAWNAHLGAHGSRLVGITYWMNRLQTLDAPVNFCVTLNDTQGIDASKVLRRIRYHHPLYTAAGVAAQERRGEISGARRTWFCGAYWGYGFHEDGVRSALDVAREFGRSLEDLERSPLAAAQVALA